MSPESIKQLQDLLKEFIKSEIDRGNVYKLESMAETLQRISYHDLGQFTAHKAKTSPETNSSSHEA